MSIYLSLNYCTFYWIMGGPCKAHDTEAVSHPLITPPFMWSKSNYISSVCIGRDVGVYVHIFDIVVSMTYVNMLYI